MTMTPADRYRANAAAFTERVEAVPAHAWENQSPCEEWTGRDVVRHVVDTSAMFLGYIGQEVPPGPSVDDDPVAAWHIARDAVQRALDDPALATREYQGMFGTQTFEEGVARFIGPDLVVHSWDLARATGGDEHLDEDACRDVLAQWAPLAPHMRAPGGFGPEIEAPPGADAQTRLLAFAGRRPT
jgi:uncharacterized protein (TIGR03086 family)